MKRIFGIVILLALLGLSLTSGSVECGPVRAADSHSNTEIAPLTEFVAATNTLVGNYCEQSVVPPVASNLTFGRPVSPCNGGSTPTSATSPQEQCRQQLIHAQCRTVALLQDLPQQNYRYYIYTLRRIRI